MTLTVTRRGARPDLDLGRQFSRAGVDILDQFPPANFDVEVPDGQGGFVFRQYGVSAPRAWARPAVEIAASKYFRGGQGTENRESSVYGLVHRVARTIADSGADQGYFDSPEETEVFFEELRAILLSQAAAFNSPVWFNVGLGHAPARQLFFLPVLKGDSEAWAWDKDQGCVARIRDIHRFPQCSACFIQGLDDTMESIMDLARSEAMLFKQGSGTGTNLSHLRSTREYLSLGGRPSGPVSFMRIYDAVAGAIKSGGAVRRAAKMQILDCTHPDIMEFVRCKRIEAEKARALVAAGYSAGMDGEAARTVCFQNSNLAVNVSDQFMDLAASGVPGAYWTRGVQGEEIEQLKAPEVLDEIATETWHNADPGLFFGDTVNHWNTCKDTQTIRSSNPCVEFNWRDDSACNLASIRLTAFRRRDGSFDTERFRHCVRVMVTAMDILVDMSSYPTRKIAEHAHADRTLGLGYADLGAYLMSIGLAYDSEEARTFAASVTALLTGETYTHSSRLAERMGAFENYEANRKGFSEVLGMHVAALNEFHHRDGGTKIEVYQAACKAWNEAEAIGVQHGYRNAQATLLAPTGMIGFLMGCDTTGIEPDYALVKMKRLAGGGVMTGTNSRIGEALVALGYNPGEAILRRDLLARGEHPDQVFADNPEHARVFHCASDIRPEGHLLMMAAVQPFLSGSISKTVNVPRETTPQEIRALYVRAWELGCKAVAVYRDGCKDGQPLSAAQSDSRRENPEVIAVLPKESSPPLSEAPQPPTRLVESSNTIPQPPTRRKMPETRQGITRKFRVGQHQGYLTMNRFPDGTPGEVFVTMDNEGSTIRGLMDALAIATSLAIQYGVPPEVLCRKLAHVRFEPSGPTGDPELPMAPSVVAHVFRMIGREFVPGFAEGMTHAPEDKPLLDIPVSVSPGLNPGTAILTDGRHHAVADLSPNGHHRAPDTRPCPHCHALAFRSGSCYACPNCFETSGCG